MTDFQSLFISQLVNTSYAEMTAVFFGLVSVWYAKKEQIWVYPTGIISVIIYIGITFQYKLYGDMGIQIYYLVMSIYGWYGPYNIQNMGNIWTPESRVAPR